MSILPTLRELQKRNDFEWKRRLSEFFGGLMKAAKLIKGNLVKSTKGSAGYDLFSDNDYIVEAKGHVIINSGVILELLPGFEAQVRGRSGNNFSKSLVVPTGTIDSDYNKEIGVKIYNLGNYDHEIKKGDRIAQLVISKVFEVEGAEELANERNGGFGSTGK